jgi:predicted acetyltransferase
VQLYRRAGYEYAGTLTLYEAAARHLPVGWPEGWRAVPVPADDPAPLAERFARVAAGRSGQIDREADWWRQFLLADRGSGPPQVFLVDGPDGPDGWAILAVSSDVSASEVRTSVQVVDWGAASEAGWRSLLTLAAGFSSLEASVHWKGPDPEPLALLVAEQDIRQLRQDRWMARVVDVPGAFAARGYPSGLRGRFTIGVSDDTCPWVDGTWTIEVDGGEGKAVRVGDDAEVATTAAGLAALFAGYHDPRDLATLGIVDGLDQADVEFLQAMHAGPSRGPRLLLTATGRSTRRARGGPAHGPPADGRGQGRRLHERTRPDFRVVEADNETPACSSSTARPSGGWAGAPRPRSSS